MGKAFNLTLYPWMYVADYAGDGKWEEEYIEKEHGDAAGEAELGAREAARVYRERNSIARLPLVNFTTQYGYGCFEGVKAFPHPDGALYLFRGDENAGRMHRSMRGLEMPALSGEKILGAIAGVVQRNYESGYYARYQKEWEANDFLGGWSVYIRPFTYSESGIGLQRTTAPSVVVVATPVGSYLDPAKPLTAVTTDMVRATPNGTGWIKCTANYVVPILAKERVERAGYAEPIFLDCREQKYVEECASCNIFFYLRDNTLVTPELNDRILPGITRKSVIELARDAGVTVEERPISIAEAMSETKECFVTGTAVGVSQITAIDHGSASVVFNDHKIGTLTRELRDTLKGIQYGLVEDRRGWLQRIG